MEVARLCQRKVVTIAPTEDLTTAAELMRKQHVGYLVVVEAAAAEGGLRPTGVLTDRDIVVMVVGKQADPRALRVGEVMSSDPVTVRDTDTVERAVQEMRRIGVRRLPVVDSHGQLTGVLSLDDVLDSLAGQLGNVAASLRNEQRIEGALRT